MGRMAPSGSSSATPPAERVEFETLLSDISARLIPVGSDKVEETVLSALEAVRLFFRADRCALCAVTDNLETIRFSHLVYTDDASNLWGDLNLALLFPYTRQRVAVKRVPLVLARLADLPPEAAVDRATFEARGTRAILCVPIQTGPTRLDLFLVSVVREEREWPDEYVPRLRLLGEMLVNTLERAQASERARERTIRLAAAVDAAELGFAEGALETGRMYLDSRACELLGLDAEDSPDRRELWLARIDAESRPVVVEKRRRLLAGEIERDITEYRYDHPRRGPIWLRQSWRRVEGEGGQGARVIGALEDVTERRQALEDVQRLRERLERENVYLRQEAKRRLGLERILGRGPAIRKTLALAEQVAATDSTVLLLGETGSGKERFASYIHELSRRHDRPMISVNCSGIPASLIESELFGREKGAYTGALSKQVGRFELAHGSTLFLDEIGDLPLEVQVKLLRVLESHTIERLGNPRPIAVDVRIVAATHRDLVGAVRDGRFREDLYYRLNVFPLTIPPLRERREDIPLLVQAFVDQLSETMGKRIQKVDPASVEALVGYGWPGNVRELRNVVERAMILAPGPVLQIHAPEGGTGEAASRTDLTAVERAAILQALNDTAWRIRGAHGAAARLGLKPTTLESRMKKLGLTRPGTRAL
jgi:formate hydrogenlyase transcriptional activator